MPEGGHGVGRGALLDELGQVRGQRREVGPGRGDVAQVAHLVHASLKYRDFITFMYRAQPRRFSEPAQSTVAH